MNCLFSRERVVRGGGTLVHEGDTITIDGSMGHVFAGGMPTLKLAFSALLEIPLEWADQTVRLKVMANADTPCNTVRATRFGAQGVGLCRTEHMVNDGGRQPIVQDMIVAETRSARRAALDKLLPIRREGFRDEIYARFSQGVRRITCPLFLNAASPRRSSTPST